ncbi:MAG: tetratricopeptide repeat protein [Pirellulales bacterium]
MPQHFSSSGLRQVWLAFSIRAAILGLACAGGILGGPDQQAADAAEPADLPQLFHTGKYAECLEAASDVVARSSFQESAWIWKVRAAAELGRYADAVSTLDAALEKLPDSIQLRFLGLELCPLAGQRERIKQLEADMLERLRKSPWRYSDGINQVVVGKWMLRQRVDPKQVLKSVFQEAQQRNPKLIDVRLAIGELALTKHDYQLASEAFQQAVQLDAQNPDAQCGLAQAFAPTDGAKATAALEAALALNPHHIPSLLLAADERVDGEEYDEALQILARIRQVNPHHPQAIAYFAVIAHLRNQREREQLLRAAALRTDAANPVVDHLIGRKLSQKYRFAEGAAYQRRALELDPNYLPAKAQLAQDLLRLGEEEEGWKLAQEVNDEDGYNVVAYNLVTLQEHLAQFQTLEAEGLLVRMDAREAAIYGQQVLDLLTRARRTLCQKYSVELRQPVIVELFPRQQDFAIRTFGLPGGAGFLGVCFGTVITANSPASQGASPSCWEATLWHEFCHVVTLHKTHNKMPRWLSEGVSVYEERLADPSWGQTMNARYRQMIVDGELTPVSQLSGAFLRPRSPLHLQFAYFEASLVVEYLVEKHGHETLLRVLDDLGAGLPLAESLSRYVGSPEGLDDAFAQYARDRAHTLAPRVDWSEPEVPRRADAAALTAWVQDHPHNYAALARLAERHLERRDWPAAAATLEEMRGLYPLDVSADGPLVRLARVYRELQDSARERAVLEELAKHTSASVSVLERLADLAEQSSDWPTVARLARRWLAVQPLSPAPHRRAAQAAEQMGQPAQAIPSYRALLALDPIDPADLHWRLAKALRGQGEREAAKRQVLEALEIAPRFRAAQQLLLELVDSQEPAP